MIASDACLVNTLDIVRKFKTDQNIHECNVVTAGVREFINLYITVFYDGPELDFQTMIDKRRQVLNQMISLELPVTAFAECTWKYVLVIVRKYDVPYDYPIPATSYGKWDVM